MTLRTWPADIGGVLLIAITIALLLSGTFHLAVEIGAPRPAAGIGVIVLLLVTNPPLCIWWLTRADRR